MNENLQLAVDKLACFGSVTEEVLARPLLGAPVTVCGELDLFAVVVIPLVGLLYFFF